MTENAIEAGDTVIIDQQQRMLKNAVVNVEEQIVVTAINRVAKNAFEEESDVITQTQKTAYVRELAAVMGVFYTTIFQVMGKQQMDKRLQETITGDDGEITLTGTFKIDRFVRGYIKEMSRKVSESHIDTVVSDLLITAREASLEGLSQQEIISRLKEKYTKDISQTRAETIARTETNRAFTRSQFEADREFVEENKLEGRAFKRWTTRSSNPCVFCQSLEAEGEIPFDQAFRGLGDDIVVGKGDDKKTLDVNFESLEAGNAHPNCSCTYTLIIRKV